MRIFHAGGLFFKPRLELHRRFFVEKRGMDGIDELIEAGPPFKRTPRGDGPRICQDLMHVPKKV